MSAEQADALTIAEEVLLLILDSEKGEIQSSLPAHSRDIVMAGAALMDLTLENRIDTDLERLVVVDPASTGDDLLDPILSDIRTQTEDRDTAFWLKRIAGRGDEIRRKAIDRLVERGILEAEVNGLVFLSRLVVRAHRYPVASEKATEEVQFRIMRTIFSQDIPDARDIVIISLAAACGVFETILSREELADVRDRIDQIAKLDLIGREVAAAVKQIEPEAPVREIAARPYEEIPQASGPPLIGSAFEMSRDIGAFLASGYRKYGPIFRVRAFNRRFLAFVGPEAVAFLTKIGNTHLRSLESWREFVSAMGSAHSVLSMDGREHLQMRKFLTKGYAPTVIEAKMDACIDVTRRLVSEWPLDQPIGAQKAMQTIVGEFMGEALTGVSPREHLDDLIFYLETNLMVYVLRNRPRLMTLLPRYRRARRGVMELYSKTLEAHRPENRAGKPPDFIDEILAMNRKDPQFLPETDHLMTSLGPYIAGLDTVASVCSYMLYALLKHPHLLAKMREEVDALFDRGTPIAKDLSTLDVTHRIILETMRMYPIIPAVTRIVSNSFEFGGFQIPCGVQIIVGNSVGHQLPEYFPDPERFDIERYQRKPPEHRQPGAYNPFGLGRHRCLGSSFADVQLMLTMATIVHEVDFALEQTDRPIKIEYNPIPHPAASFRFRVTNKRRRTA